MRGIDGIDVSKWQGKIDWIRVRRAGIGFAMIKASQGKLLTDPDSGPFTDPRFAENMKRANGAGIPLGAFHYLCARTVGEAEAEADYFVRVLKPYKSKISLWAAIDAEDETYLPRSRELLTAIVRRFAEIVRAAGYKPMLYSNPNYLTWRLIREDVAELPLWLAYYGVSEEEARRYGPKIWQPKTGRVDGIGTDVDIDVGYFGETAEIRPGDRVRVVSPYIYGTLRRFAVYYDVYDVLAVDGDRAVIGIGSVVTAAVNVKNLRKAGE